MNSDRAVIIALMILANLAAPLIVIMLIAMVASCSHAGEPDLTINIPARVYHIVDGDTLDVETTIRFRVRIRDCWTPESRTRDLRQKKLGLAAKENLKKVALGKRVVIVLPFGADKLESHSGRIDDVQTMSRWLCEVWINGKRRVADIQFNGGFSGRTKDEQKKLFPKTQEMEIDP